MEIRTKQGSLIYEKADVILVDFFEGDKTLPPEVKKMDSLLGGLIKRILRTEEFSGKLFQFSLFHVKNEIPAKKIILVGLGKKDQWSLEKTRQVMGKISGFLEGNHMKSVAARLLGKSAGISNVANISQAMVEGFILGSYQFNAYRTDKSNHNKKISQISVIVEDQIKEVRRGIERGKIIAEATNYVRDLANHPSNVVTPSRMAKEARSIAKSFRLKCRVLDRKQMEKKGMGAILGVSKGSMEPPQFITLEYGTRRKGKPSIALVGKSVTFDTGGISLKPSDKMDQMKDDMAGGGAVLGAIKAVAQLKLPLHVVGILPAAENMPSGTAIKPGDVLKSLSGQTIEVLNTDAEGRLCLADALTYATLLKPDAIIDLATLTGACVVALGHHAIGAMSRSPQVLEKIKAAGEATGERVWELPLWEDYEAQIKSDIADMKNIGGRGAGTITAGLFLHKFVGKTPWVHLDIAGTAWTDKDLPYCPKGGTGIGVRLLVEYLTRSSEENH